MRNKGVDMHIIFLFVAFTFGFIIITIIGYQGITQGGNVTKHGEDIYKDPGGITPRINIIRQERFECKLPDSLHKQVNYLSCDDKKCYLIKHDGYVKAYTATPKCGDVVYNSNPLHNTHGWQLYCDKTRLPAYCFSVHDDGVVVQFLKDDGGQVGDKINLNPANGRALSIECDSRYCYAGGQGEIFRIDRSAQTSIKKIIKVHPQSSRAHFSVKCDTDYCYVATNADEALDREIYLTKFAKSEFDQGDDIDHINNERISDFQHSGFSCQFGETQRAAGNDMYCESNAVGGNFDRCYIPATVKCIGTGQNVWRTVFRVTTNTFITANYTYRNDFGVYPIVTNLGIDCDEKYCYVANMEGSVTRAPKIFAGPNVTEDIYSGVSMMTIKCDGNHTHGTCYSGYADGTYGWFKKKII